MHTALFDAIPDALVIVDEGGRILMANRMAYRLFGYTPPALVGLPVETLLPVELRERHRRHRRMFRRQPRERPMGQAHMALVGLRSDGTRFPVEIALNPIELGLHTQVLASIRDVSDTPIAQRVQRRARHDAALARIGQQIVGGQDLEHVMHDVACALTEAVGAGPVWIVLREPTGAYRVAGLTTPPPGWLDARGDALFAALAPGDAPSADGGRLDPGLLPDSMTVGLAYPLVTSDGTVNAALAAFSHDPDAFDADVERLFQTTATMLSAARQRQQAHEALVHAQRLEAIGQLTGGVAHDFNNLLTVVSGNLQMLEPHVEGDGEAHELLAAAVRAVDHGAALTRKLLSFAGRQRLRPAPVSLGREMHELERLARATLGDRVRLSVSADPDLPAVRVDPPMLDSVVLNLVLNARDAIEGAGDVEIRVREERLAGDADAGHYVALSVRDTGCGMSEEALAHAWEPFYTTKSAGRGTGLGLSTVYGFVRQSGGHVQLRSRPGEGTTVTLYLPVSGDAEPDVFAQPQAVVGGNEVVLLVEDDDAVRTTVEGSLKSLGYHVIATGSPQAALECVETLQDIALLFTDFTLADAMTGAQLAHEARRVRPDLAVLLTSGHPDAGATDRVDRFALLAKPYHHDELARAIRAALSEVRRRPAPA